ncbi:NAD(P)H-dependent flavin oxidoreductase [Burkholderia lata]|uniref:NAD(P)H-dependent flavin oxidoreductase n=1 Tax=Burkholderia lata (strain ATCC 17760 / DSM 23089 / LMG 22485 / NCIMB 9086 / R18194 / 383) TaxID=482957 RepID=UPI00266FAAD4|nr:nitronate monooxygenase [Burkholderia lata]
MHRATGFPRDDAPPVTRAASVALRDRTVVEHPSKQEADLSRLKTPLCELLNIEYPILQAGMGGVAFGPLAAAVSKAGGLGTIAAISPTPERVEQEIKLVRSLTDKPLCVDIGFPLRAPKNLASIKIENLPSPIVQLQKEIEALGIEVKPVDDQAMGIEDAKTKLEICFAHKVEVIACALGTPAWVVDECHARGVKVISMVGSARHAKTAIKAGTDVVVVQGTEGGGHTGDVGLITLLAEVLEFSPVPVVAAGGIVTGAQIAAVLTQGAQGVWVGTRFIGSQEATVGPNYKQSIVEAGYDQTIRSLLFDGLYVRQLKNRYTEVWEGHEDEMLPYPEQRVAIGPVRFASVEADLKDHQPLPAGQGSSLIRDVPPAGDVLRRLVDETVATLKDSRGRVEFA